MKTYCSYNVLALQGVLNVTINTSTISTAPFSSLRCACCSYEEVVILT